ILTVARAAARAAGDCDANNLATVVVAAVTAADAALVRTPEQLPTLARAGVVDAGGQGLCVLLHALAEVITGVRAPRGPLTVGDRVRPTATDPVPPTTVGTEAAAAGASPAEEQFEFEVQYLLDATDARIGPLREVLGALGDSLVVVGTGDGSWNVHVHVNDVGAAVEAGIEAGRPYRIRVTRLSRRSEDSVSARSVAVFVDGDGLNELLRAEGALTSLGGVTGQVVALGMPPTSWAGGELRVIPLRSPVQALAAFAVHDPARPFDDDVIAMAEAAGACRFAEVTVATREALTLAGPCRPGDVLVLVDGEVNLVGEDMGAAAEKVLDRMLAVGGELVTLLLGVDASPELGERLQAYLAKRWPFVEARAYPGGQRQPLLMGVE
nr:DAK2 domain-containing protein [Longispora sp. (in: high G+C Gram-positive bacteria)]